MTSLLFKRVYRKLWPGTIRTRLLLVIAMVVLPLAGIRLFRIEQDGRVQIAQARARVVEMAQAGVRSSQDVIEQARLTLDILSHVPLMTAAGMRANCNGLLTGIQQTRPWSAGLHIADATGTVICSSMPETIGANLADRAYVRQAIASNSFVVGDFMIGRKSGRPMIGSAMPVRDKSGMLTHTLILNISAQWLGKVANDIAATYPDSSVMLIDGSGVILGCAPDHDGHADETTINADMAAGLMGMTDSRFDAIGPDGRERIYGVAAFPSSNALLLIGLSRDEVVADAVQARRYALIALCLLCLLSGAAIWAFGKYSVEMPIRKLLMQSQDIGKGKLDRRLNSRHWPRELAALAQSMNLMSDRLERRGLQLQKAQEKLRRQALTDPLTGLANRRAIDEGYTALWQAAFEAQRPLAVAMLDADHFKSYNDTYGHEAGDRALEKLGHLLNGVAESAGGLAARMGGEEFVLVLPGRDEAGALALADRLCAAVRDLGIVHERSQTGILTISVGVAGLIPPRRQVDRLLMRSADAALYGAKTSGRDRAMGNARLASLNTPPAGPARPPANPVRVAS